MQRCTYIFFILSALVICSNAQRVIDLDNSTLCSTRQTIKFGQTATVATNGSITMGDQPCRINLEVEDGDGKCDQSKALLMCLTVENVQRMCYANVEFSGADVTPLNIDCMTVKDRPKWCAPVVAEKPGIQIVSQMHKTNKYSPYKFAATVTTECGSQISKGAQSEPVSDDFNPANLEEAVHQSRVVGIVVGVCLAVMFLIALFVTYFYYKNKAYTGVPQEA